jgi:SAM-dependent methyltransferase
MWVHAISMDLEYLGIDMIPGPSVDRVINADDLANAYGENSFDVVICMETMEHSRFWRKTLSNIKSILKPGGYLILTAPAPGYPYHGHPTDFWRYTPDDFKHLLKEYEILGVEFDAAGPGSFIAAKKPEGPLHENDLSKYPLFSILTGRKIIDLTPDDYKTGYYYRLILKHFFKWAIENIYHGLGRIITKIFRLNKQ